MARAKREIQADVDPITCDGTEADMRCWVQVTKMLLRARARREARQAAAAAVRRTALTVSFTVARRPSHTAATAFR